MAHSGPTTEAHGDKVASQTRERILNAAERLFAEHGLEGVSTRDITTAAGANVGAINYYFGSKAGLVFAVFDRRLTPITEERVAGLDALEKATGQRAPSPEEVLLSYIRPAVEHALDPKWGGTSFAKLMGRLVGEPGTRAVEKLKKTHFDRFTRRYDAALLRAIPGLSAQELSWRKVFIIGALHYMLLTIDQALPGLEAQESDRERLIRRLVSFAVAGLRSA